MMMLIIRKIISFLLIINYCFILNVVVNCQNVKIISKIGYHLTKYKDNVFIIDMKNIMENHQDMSLSCVCQSCINLQYTFINNYNNQPHKNQEGENQVFKYRDLTIMDTNILETTRTGLYTCSGQLSNGKIEKVSYYLYFYPNNGELFVKCGLFDTLGKCLKVLYPLRKKFTVPCISVHPEVRVEHNIPLPDTNNSFVYDPQIGFTGILMKDFKKFSCRGTYQAFSQTQDYDLLRIDVREFQITLPGPNNPFNQVPTAIGKSVTVLRGDTITFKCQASLNCDYYNYEMSFITNLITPNFDFTINDTEINRSRCHVTNALDVRRHIVIRNIQKGFFIECGLTFGTYEVKTNDINYIYIAEKPFIESKPNLEIQPEYLGNVQVRIPFSASADIDYKLFFKDNEINCYDMNNKHYCTCTQLDSLNFTCDCFIEHLNDNDQGIYTLKLSLKRFSNITHAINFTVILPKKPEITIVRPRTICTLNFTCEYDRIIEFQCTAEAHNIETILMFSVPCNNLSDCYDLRTKKIEELIDEYELKYPKARQNSKSTFTKVNTKQPNLIICTAINDLGDSTGSVIVIPSELENGRLFKNTYINMDRPGDTQIVEQDKFMIRLDYNHQFYSNDVKFTKPNNQCSFKEYTNQTQFTRSLFLVFNNVTQPCANNYTFTILSNNHKYLNATKRDIFQNITIEKPLKPTFVENFNFTTGNKTVITSFIEQNVYKIVSDDDQSISLDCRSIGRPTPFVTWFLNQTQLNVTDTDEKYSFTDKSQRMRILRSHSTDSGLYKCEVSNRFGFIERKFDIDVKGTVIISKKLTEKQKALIGSVSVIAFILLILFVAALVYALRRERAHKALKKIIRLLRYDGSGTNDFKDVERFINTKLEYLERLKFDEEYWEIDPSHFYIDTNKVLGQGNFGKVCVAYISRSTAIRDEEQLKNEPKFEVPQKQGLRRGFSIKKTNFTTNPNYETSQPFTTTTSPLPQNDDETSLPLLNQAKDLRKAAAKMAKDFKVNSSNIDSLLQELKIMAHVNNPYTGTHLNLIQLIGSCTSQLVSNGIAYVFVEYCDRGDLKSWLKKTSARGRYAQNDDPKTSLISEYKKRFSRQSTLDLFDFAKSGREDKIPENEDAKFNDSDLVFFCYQIAKGMEFLAKKRFLHRDLAARNILLTKNYECKISDFGLADESKLNNAAFYGMAKNTSIPAKWTAPEVFRDFRYEANSDVWSFGITIWEIFTLGKTDPYPNVTNADFREYKDKIFSGEEVISTPDNGSDEIHNLMRKCLEIDFMNRPTFEQLVPVLEGLVSDVHKHYYSVLTEGFKKQSHEWKREIDKNYRRSNSIQDRNSEIKSQSADQYLNTSNYIKPDTYGSGSTTGKYLSNSSTKPTEDNKPVKPTNSTQKNSNDSTNDDRYLEASTPRKSSLPDTYGSDSESDAYLEAFKDIIDKKADDSARNSDNFDLLPPKKPPIAPKPKHLLPNIHINDKTLNSINESSDDKYLLPRYGSGVSSSSRDSNSSTTPLNNTRSDVPQPLPRRINTNKPNI